MRNLTEVQTAQNELLLNETDIKALFMQKNVILGPLWVWLVIKEQPSTETIFGGIVIIATIAIHSFLGLKKT